MSDQIVKCIKGNLIRSAVLKQMISLPLDPDNRRLMSCTPQTNGQTWKRILNRESSTLYSLNIVDVVKFLQSLTGKSH